MVKYLLKNGATIEKGNSNSEYSAFFLAIIVANLEILSYLANHDTNKNAKTKSLKTVLKALDLKKLIKNHPNRSKKVINYLQ
jgi:hypothetical protein